MTKQLYTVLIVDPTEAGERLAQRCSDHGLNVLLARTAERALDYIIEESPDVAVVELELPDAPGTDLAAILSGDAKIPMFMASAARLPADDAELESVMLGVEGVLAKPYQIDSVVAELARVLGTEVETLRSAAAATTEATGQRWGSEDLAEDEAVMVLDEVVEEAVEAGDPSAAPATALDGASAAAAVEAADELDLVAVWERKVAEHRLVERPQRPTLTARSGRIEETSVVQLFDSFYRAGRSGELGLIRGKAKRLILFADGNPVFARSNIARERLGTQFVEAGLITEGQLRDALLEAGGNDQRVGDVLVRQELLSDAHRRQIVTRTVSQIVLSSFAWRDGEYHLGLVERARTEPQIVPLFAGNVILRGLTLTTPAADVRAAVALDARFAPAPNPPYPMERLKLSDAEVHLVIAADGTKTVADLLALFDIGEDQALGLLYGLSKLGVIELVGHGAAKARSLSFF